MRYIRFFGGTGYCGEEFEKFSAYEDEISDRELDIRADEHAKDNADNFFISKYCNEDFESEEEFQDALYEELEEYYYEVWGNWEEITRDEFMDETVGIK